MVKYNSYLLVLVGLVVSACSAPQYPDYQATGAKVVDRQQGSGEQQNKEAEKKQENIEDIQSQRYDKIALLLPKSSKFSRAAQAFEDGFREAHRDSTMPIRPLIQTYDIGKQSEQKKLANSQPNNQHNSQPNNQPNSQQIGQQSSDQQAVKENLTEQDLLVQTYNQAISEDADFIVGPLGNEALEKLADKADFRRSTLAIAQIPEDENDKNLYGFSLSPEAEARQVAQYAYRKGYRSSRIFRPDNAWGKRVAMAFENEWQKLGGTIEKNLFYPRGISDYSSSVRNLLGARQSEQRHRTIQSITDLELNHQTSASSRGFVFLVANTQTARIIVPQIRFHDGHNVDIFSISTIYSGGVDKVLDLDLEGVTFSELRWVLQNTQISANSKFNKRSKYQGTPLDRIYDLGYESYGLVFKVKELRGKQAYIKGKTMDLRIDEKGNIEPVFSFANFKQGVARPVSP